LADGTTNTSGWEAATTGALRLISLEIPDGLSEKKDIDRTVATYTARFLESHVKPPFRYDQVTPTSFIVHGACRPNEFEDFLVSLQLRLREFLFGSETASKVDIVSFTGSDDALKTFMMADDATAKRRADSYLNAYQTRHRDITEQHSAWRYGWQGDARIFTEHFRYRGILECKQRVMIGQAITVADHHSETQDDIHVGRFMAVRAPHTIDFEIAAYKHSRVRAEEAYKAGLNSIVLTPISYHTLIVPEAREKYLKAIEGAPSWAKNLTGLVVFCAPENASVNAIQRCAEEFSPYFRFIDWQVRSVNFQPSQFANSRLNTLTFDIHDQLDKRIEAIKTFGGYADALRKMRILPGITGVKTRDEVLTAIKSGIRYLSGPAITCALKTPCPIMHVSPAELPFQGTSRSLEDALPL
tara:strand:+ start:13493 stop:14731 length:1239 start_codon:yes stop_codon:yes gene_type:complete